TALHRFRDSHGHAAVLERTRWIDAFVLHENIAVTTNPLTELRTIDQRRVPLAQGNNRGFIVDLEEIAITLDHSPGPLPFGYCRVHRHFLFETNPHDCRSVSAV